MTHSPSLAGKPDPGVLSEVVTDTEMKPAYPVTWMPSWNTPEYPAEVEEEDLSLTDAHTHICHYFRYALETLLARLGAPFTVALDRSLYFDWHGLAQHVSPDVVVYPFYIQGSGSVRLQSGDPSPRWIMEVFSSATVAQDRGEKRDWFADLGVEEYWTCNPMASPELQDQPLLEGWHRVATGFQAIPLIWEPTTRRWIGRSTVLQHDLCMPLLSLDTAWHYPRYPGPRLRSWETEIELPTYHEQRGTIDEQQNTIDEQQGTIDSQHQVIQALQQDQHRNTRQALMQLVQARFDTETARLLGHWLDRRDMTSWPDIGTVYTWTQLAQASDFLQAVRDHFGHGSSA